MFGLIRQYDTDDEIIILEFICPVKEKLIPSNWIKNQSFNYPN